MLSALPVLSICGDPGVGRTCLIRDIVQQFQQRGIRARHLAANAGLTAQQLQDGARRYDLVLVEDLNMPSVPVLWLSGEHERPAGSQIVAVAEKGPGRREAMIHGIDAFLLRQWRATPVLGCLLIGGRSTRMGHAKHQIVRDGQTWLQRTAATLAQVCGQVVVVGQGDMEGCGLPQLSDVPGCAGPMAGLLSAMRSFPWNTILACACDMPEMSADALVWLLDQRQPGRRAVIPQVDGRYEPLLALYDFRMFSDVEVLASQQRWRLSALAAVDGAYVVEPPSVLRRSWHNLNSQEMLCARDVVVTR